MKKDVGLIGGIVALLFLFSTAHATIWYVHPDSTLNSIQAGLDSCATNDTVLVGPGFYIENITWPSTDGIHLNSEYGSDTTIIDGDSVGRVISITFGVDTTTVIRGFTIRNGYGNLFGAGILCDGSSPRIVSNVFTANGAYGYMYGGGAIGCMNYSSPVIDSNTMVGNYGTHGGAIGLSGNCDATITSNLIHDNAADTTGGGIDCYGYCNPTIAGNTITENSAKWGGGVAIWYQSSPVVNGNVISGNIAITMGGGIYCYNYVSPTITNNIITENTCNLYGAGIRCSPNTSGVIGHCIISNNYGWGIGISESSPDIDSCAIEYNTNRGVYILAGANPTINWCNIVGNQYYGVYSTNASVTVDAENNWWGAASGPGGVGPGTGNPVSDYVDFNPWATGPFPWGIEEHEPSQPITTLLQISPNPFRDRVNIKFSMEHSAEVIELKIYDATGRLVRQWGHTTMRLSDHISWEGTDHANRKLPSGVYFLKLVTGDYSATEKLLLIR